MINAERMIQIARNTVSLRQAIIELGGLTLIDNNLRDGIELARAVNGGYVSQLTTAGERQLIHAHTRIVVLHDTLARPATPTPQTYAWAEVTNIEVVDGFTRLTDRSNLVVHLGDSDVTAYALPDDGNAFLEADRALMTLGHTVPAFGWRHESATSSIRTTIRPIRP